MNRLFAFALQPLLERYESIEREARGALTAAQRGFAEATRESERLHRELRLHAGALKQRKDPTDCALHYAQMEHLHWVIRQQRGTVCASEGRVNKMRLVFTAASKKRKTLEELKTRRANAHVARAQLLEERHIDEANIHVRKVAVGGY